MDIENQSIGVNMPLPLLKSSEKFFSAHAEFCSGTAALRSEDYESGKQYRALAEEY